MCECKLKGEPSGWAWRNPLGRSWKSHLDSHFPNSPPTSRRLVLQAPQWCSGHIQLPTQLKRSGTIRKQGWRQAGGPGQPACGRLHGARPRCTRARGAPRASGLPWSGLAAAGRKVSAAARLLAGASTGPPCHPTPPPATLPRRPRTATPGRLVCSVPSAPGPQRAAQVQLPTLPASALPPPTPTPTATLHGSGDASSLPKSRNITLWPHPAPRYLLAAPSKPALASREPANPARGLRALLQISAPRPPRRPSPYLGGLHFRSRRQLELLLGYPEEQQHGDPEHPEDRQSQAAIQTPHGPVCLVFSATLRPWGTPWRSGSAGQESWRAPTSGSGCWGGRKLLGAPPASERS